MPKLPMHTKNIADENFKKLAALFPQAVTEVIAGEDEDGKPILERAIDKDILMAEIAAHVVEGNEQRYQFTWPDKAKTVHKANQPLYKTLRPCREESVNFDTTENLYIEGDNLEVLKLLQETYLNKIKMIYIDPPYNTGKDFVYNDIFAMDGGQFAIDSGQYDEDGNRLYDMRVNNENNGRFHTDWLNMLYPRLRVARDVLRDDGIIFISIDDNELHNLKKICDEIFGKENFLEQFVIQVRYASKSLNEKDDFQKLIEFCLVYAKQKTLFIPKKPHIEYNLNKFSIEIIEKKIGKKIILGNKNVTIFSKDEYSIIKHETGSSDLLKETWATGSVLKGNTSGKFFSTYLEERKNIDGLGTLYKVEGIGDDGIGYRYFTGPRKETATKGLFYSGIPLGKKEEMSRNNGKAIKEKPIINFYDYSADFGNIRHEGGVNFRSGKKPVKMLSHLLEISNSKEDDIILDFFSGSATTAHAVMQSNAKDGGKRKYIMVQMPENLDEQLKKADTNAKNTLGETINFLDSIGKPHYISEIGKERIRRAGAKILESVKEKEAQEQPHGQASLLNSNAISQASHSLDVGFRVLKVDSTNMLDVYYTTHTTTPQTLLSLTTFHTQSTTIYASS